MPGHDVVSDIAENLDAVRRRLRAAAERVRRSPSDIQLVAVSKTFGPELVRAAAAAGQHDFGENRVQEGLEKIEQVSDVAGLRWHLIGHLQSNKAKRAAAAFAWIQSVDSRDLLRKIDAAAHDAGTRPRVLVQVDLAREETKFGVDEQGLKDLTQAALEARAVELCGLMIVPPIPDDPEDARPWFKQLREIRDELVAGGVPAERLRELSMGMSHDFEVAIEEGATIVRVGTAIFGRRPPPSPEPVTDAPLRITRTATGTRLEIRVMPRAPRTGLDGVRDGRLVLRVTAAPVDSAANDAALTALAKTLGLPRSALTISAGHTHRNKTIDIAAPVDGVKERLTALLDGNQIRRT